MMNLLLQDRKKKVRGGYGEEGKEEKTEDE